MLRQLVTKLGWALFTVWAVVTLTFLLFNTLPGDPARTMAGPQARPRDVARIRTQMGLDQPLPTRYVRHMSRMIGFGATDKATEKRSARLGPLRLDLGESYLRRKPVVELLGKALPATLLVGVLALFIQIGLGTLGGVIAAYRRHTVFDWGTVGLTLLGISAPTFITGLVLQHFLGRSLGWFPLDGYGDTLGERLHAAFLPALTLGAFGAAYTTRLVRDEMIGILKLDFIRTARAKGLSERAVVIRHALRNALVPLATVVALNMGTLVGGAVVTEQIFRWPGIGKLTIDAIKDRDGPVVMGIGLLFATVVVLSNLLVDLSYAALDPRIRRR